MSAHGTANISVAERAVRCDASPPHVEVCRRGVSFPAGFHHRPFVAWVPSRCSCVCRRSCARRNLGSNQLSGSLPSWLGSMKSLTNLCVSVIASARSIATARSFAASVCLFAAGTLPRPLVAQGLRSCVRRQSCVPRYLNNNLLSGLLPSSLGMVQLKILCVVVCAKSECVALPLLGLWPRCLSTASSLRGCRASDIYMLMRAQATVQQPAVGLVA